MNPTPFYNRTFDALLFDMDGTLVTTVMAAERVWGAWGNRHGLDVPALLKSIHGVRAIETVRRLLPPEMDHDEEVRALEQAEIDQREGIAPIPGAVEFLKSLPADRWAIVTSGTLALVSARIELTGIPRPSVIVTADDVEHGKPAPDCFQLAAKRLGFSSEDCLVFEDAPAGIRGAEAAGARVMIITATHSGPSDAAHPSAADYLSLRAVENADGSISV